MKHNYQYHYLYRIDNLVNGRYYYGVHSTNNLDDGYMGSGVLISKAISKHGIENFRKVILEYFETDIDAYKRESEIVTESLIKRDKLCYNLCAGGRGGLSNMVTVTDGTTNFNVYVDDVRYLSGELKPACLGKNAHKIPVRDKNGNTFSVKDNDPRYLSGELVHVTKYLIPVRDKDGNTFSVKGDDPRYLSGELVHVTKDINKNKIPVIDENGQHHLVTRDDPRYLSGEWKQMNVGKIWIHKGDLKKQILKSQLTEYINNDWNLGKGPNRKIKLA